MLAYGITFRRCSTGTPVLHRLGRRLLQAAHVLRRGISPPAGPMPLVDLAVLGRRFAVAPDLASVADVLVAAVARCLGSGIAAAVAFPDGPPLAALRVVAVQGRAGAVLYNCRVQVAEGALARAWSQQEPVLAPVRRIGSGELAGRLDAAGAERLWIIPLSGREGPLGLLLLDATPPLPPAALRTAELLAALAGLAAAHALTTLTLNELASGAAHEVRNALTGLRGMIQLAAAVPERAQPRLAAALAEADHAAVLAGDLLALTRPLALHPVPVNLSDLVDAVLALCPTDGVCVERSYRADGPVLFADPERLRQVIYNLVTNALAATGGHGRLTLRTGADAGFAWLAVGDTGPGIAPEHVPHLFRPFFSTRPGGNGLGLAVCRRLVEAHGGHITVDSPPGAGATFTLHLPWPGAGLRW